MHNQYSFFGSLRSSSSRAAITYTTSTATSVTTSAVTSVVTSVVTPVVTSVVTSVVGCRNRTVKKQMATSVLFPLSIAESGIEGPGHWTVELIS
ncbi:MAG: hypothetical protein ABI363_06410 [Nitrosospira sp.]